MKTSEIEVSERIYIFVKEVSRFRQKILTALYGEEGSIYIASLIEDALPYVQFE